MRCVDCHVGVLGVSVFFVSISSVLWLHVLVFGQFKNMFITSQYRQHASHTLASRAYGPQPHMRSSPTSQDHT